MIYSLTGKIVHKSKEVVVIDVHDVAYECLVSRAEDFAYNEITTIYTYEVYGENEHYLAGFSTLLEKEAFQSLITVKGIGPKTALNALSATSADALFKAIQSNNTSYLKKLPGIGPKAAAQIILDLKGHLAEDGGKADPKQYDEVRAALKSLGFRVKEIDDALSSISDPTLDSQGLLKAALKKLRKNK